MRRGRPKIEITPEQVEKVLTSDVPMSVLAGQWGIGYATLLRRMKEAEPDFDGNNRRERAWLVPEIIKLRRKGLSTHAIGRQLGISQTHAWMVLKRKQGQL